MTNSAEQPLTNRENQQMFFSIQSNSGGCRPDVETNWLQML